MATEGKRLPDFVIGIHDPRTVGRTDHALEDILVLALCAVMAGTEGWDDIEDWGIENEAMLRRYLRLRNGIPGHDTIRRVHRGTWAVLGSFVRKRIDKRAPQPITIAAGEGPAGKHDSLRSMHRSSVFHAGGVHQSLTPVPDALKAPPTP